MTKKLDTTFIQIVHPVCCGLDVHKKKISACLITIDEHGQELYEIEEFGTFTNDLWLSGILRGRFLSKVSVCYPYF